MLIKGIVGLRTTESITDSRIVFSVSSKANDSFISSETKTVFNSSKGDRFMYQGLKDVVDSSFRDESMMKAKSATKTQRARRRRKFTLLQRIFEIE